MGSPIKKGSKKNKVPKQKRSQNNQGCGQIRAPGKQRLGTNKVPGWARSANEPTHILGNGDPETPRMLDKLGPQINEVPKQTMQCPQTNKSPEQKRSSNKCSPPKEQGPPTVEVPKQLRSINKQLPQWTNTFMNYPVVQIVIVVPTLKWSCHVSTNSHEKQFHGNTPKRALCSFHLYVF